MHESTMEKLAESLPQSAAVFKPNEGKVVSFVGSTLSWKNNSNGPQNWRIAEGIGIAGNCVPLHTHPWSEGFYVLAGEIDVQIEDQIVLATPGYCLQIPAGVAHGSVIRSPQAKMLIWVSDICAEQFSEELSQLPDEPQPEMVMTIRKKYGVLSAQARSAASEAIA